MSDAEAEGEMPERGREVWIEKYRPESLDDVLGHDHITERLESYIERNDLPHLLFAGPAGTGKCVTGETPVLTNRGVARIEDVVGDVEGFATSDDGTEVLTLGQDGEFQYVEPSHVFGKRTDDLVSVRTRDGAAMTVTPEHKLLVLGHDGLEWKPAIDLSSGERVARPLSVPLSAGDGTLDWVTAMDGEHTFVHVTEEFAAEYGIPAEEDHVGTKKAVVAGLRQGLDEDEIAAAAETTKNTVRVYRRQLADTDLDEPSTVCSLSYLRSLDVHRDELKQHVEGIQYVTRYNQRSRPITPPWSVTPALATFIGLVVSEARIDNGKIEFFNTDGQLLERFEEAATELFDVEPERGEQKGVPCSVITTKSLTHYLESCFDVFAGATGRDGIGSAMVGADRESRSAFLRAVFDGEAYVQTNGIIELTQKNGELITLLSYLLAGFGIPSRRKTQRKAATNGSGRKREYHVLYLSGAHNLSRFQDCVGFSLEHKAERVAANAARTHNPNDDTIPVQDEVDTLCESLYLSKNELLTESLNSETPGRGSYLQDLERVLAAANDKLETAQLVLERLDDLSSQIDAAAAVPARWIGARDALGPIETRHEVAETTAIRSDRLLENDDHGLTSLSRFATVAERVETMATEMLSMEVLASLRTLHLVTTADLYYDEVESVERLTGERRVYDLTVPVTRNYVAGHVPTVMHNTTCAVAIAKELYGEDWRENFLELNASDERGIDVVRERIKNFARASFGGHDYRIIFLDEADALCVPPGTEVVTGYPSSPEVKKIEDVAEDGEPIPSVDFQTNEIQSDKGRLVDSGVADFFEVELADGRAITASPTHPFFVVGGDGTLVEKELRELSPGDEIADFKDDIGVSRCDTCGDWTAGDEFEPALVSDGGLRTVETTEIRRIEYSHREKAYNISMEGTPNFMLANGILTHNTSDAQAALRRTMEQFSNNTRFILSCNFSSQIIDPIQSRCAVFRFSPLDDEAVEEQIRRIAEQEDIEITDDGVDALVYAADGDMRKAINGLQAAAVMGETVDEGTVFTITSTVRPEEIRELVTHALEGDFSQARSKLDDLLTEAGIAGGDVIDQIHRSAWEFDLDDDAAVRLMERVGEADYRITAGANEQVQLEALLASLALDED